MDRVLPLRRALAGALVLAAACATDPPPAADRPSAPREDPAPPLRRAPWTPPADWASTPPLFFERLVADALPEGTTTPLAPATLQALGAALERQDATSVRAAVLLARADTAEAAEVLLRRLETRAQASERGGDAGDVVAAAALVRSPSPTAAGRLEALAAGPSPHPDLEVRVECACTALALGRDTPVPFLLQVLRIDTWAGAGDARDFEVSPTTAWARDRAARALAARAGVAVTYRADASIADREREARRLAAALGARAPR